MQTALRFLLALSEKKTRSLFTICYQSNVIKLHMSKLRCQNGEHDLIELFREAARNSARDVL